MHRSILLAAALVVMTIMSQAYAEDRLNASVLDHPTSVTDFALTDDNGQPFSLQRLKGHWSLLAVGYTSCPDVCPFTMSDLDAVVHAIAALPGQPLEPMVVFVAVDPARDKPVLKDWVDQFNPGFFGITGQDSQIAGLVKSIGGFYQLGKPDKNGYYVVTHSGGVSVIDPEGRMRARVLLPMPPKKTAAFLTQMMQTARARAQPEGPR
jgi:protein SCO1/2